MSGNAVAAGRLTLIRDAGLVAVPWKNGGGLTREVASYPARGLPSERAPRALPPARPQHAALDDFVWRVSVADVAQAGPFSRFEGIDRTLVLLSGAGMLLDETDAAGGKRTHALTQPLDSVSFAGEAAIDARLVDGATRDFNLMVRRGAALGELEIWRGDMQRSVSADVVLLFCASGPAGVEIRDGHGSHDGQDTHDGQRLSLATGDTLRIDAPNALHCTVKGAGALLAISIRYAQA